MTDHITDAAQSVGMREALEDLKHDIELRLSSRLQAKGYLIDKIDAAIASQPSPAATVETDDLTDALNTRQAEINESMARPSSSAGNDDDLLAELRRHEKEYPSLVHGPLCGRAADEIERLRAVPQRSAGNGRELEPVLNSIMLSIYDIAGNVEPQQKKMRLRKRIAEHLASLAVTNEPKAAPNREFIAKAICCPKGCVAKGDCQADKRRDERSAVDAVLSALSRPQLGSGK